MNQVILFKAKRTDNGEWVEGYYLPIFEKAYIICEAEAECVDGENTDLYATEWYEVDPETVCQYTGLKDKNNKEIWKNDIVLICNENVCENDGYFVVKWDNECSRFILEGEGLVLDFESIYTYECEAVGNVFDNPELLEVEE